MPRHHPDAESFRRPGCLRLFGYEPTAARVEVLRRPRRWRLGRALRVLAVAGILAPVVALVPPHAPWVVAVLATGGVLARRRWTERFTLTAVEGACPKCGNDVTVSRKTRLRTPHPVACEVCRHESVLEVSCGGSGKGLGAGS